MDALFLDHYDRELAYLREMGNAFAIKYPKLAGRLGLDEFQCSDPFVERLLEGFAFMSARVQRRMDAEFPQLTRGILDSVYPHYARPIPSAGIFQLNPAQDEGALIEGFRVPKGTRLIAEVARGQQTGCRFDTTSDLDLWPLRISQVELISRETTSSIQLPRAFHQSNIRSVLRIAIDSTVAIPIQQWKLDSLRLHFRGGEIAQQLYESLLAHTQSIGVSFGSSGTPLHADSWHVVDADRVRPVGYGHDESLLPGDCRSFSGYRLLQEYFVLAEKFLFVDVVDLQSCISKSEGNQLHLLFGLTTPPSKLLNRTSVDHIALHCVPAVNLFPRRADRIHLDHTQHEHQILADRSRPVDFEIWSIEEMDAYQASSAVETPCLPLYAPPSASADTQKRAIYYSSDRRQRLPGSSPRFANRTAYLGSEVFVSLTDLHNNPSVHDFQQLAAQVYCTNRDLPLFTPDNGWRNAFHLEISGPIANVLCLTGPTYPRPPLVSEEGEAAWRLISHLTPNYLSLTDSAGGGAAMLRELLQLYCTPDNASSLRQIEGLLHVRHNPIVRRVPLPGPMTFARGVEIELVVDEDAFEGGGAFLLSSILEKFFARYVSLNSFTETHLVSDRRGSVYRWPSRLGDAPVL
jgi:type VI secretion system protein ImpG